MTTSGTAAACGAAARPRAMCPLARRAPSVASPQRFSSSLSFSLALSLHITCPLFSPCSNAGSPCLPTHPVASGDGLGSTTPHEPRAGESAHARVRGLSWLRIGIVDLDIITSCRNPEESRAESRRIPRRNPAARSPWRGIPGIPQRNPTLESLLRSLLQCGSRAHSWFTC